MRFGSRRIQRPSHQKILSKTTANETIETIRIGHMIGPPALNFAMKKFLSSSLCGEAEGLGLPLGDAELVVVVVVVAGDIPGTDAVAIGLAPGDIDNDAAGEVPGTAGLVAGIAGEVTGMVVAGLIAVAGLVAVVGGAPGGLAAGEVAGGVWPNDVSARVTVQRLAISSVFIGLILYCPDRGFR
jgi:hypothetical protein